MTIIERLDRLISLLEEVKKIEELQSSTLELKGKTSSIKRFKREISKHTLEDLEKTVSEWEEEITRLTREGLTKAIQDRGFESEFSESGANTSYANPIDDLLRDLIYFRDMRPKPSEHVFLSRLLNKTIQKNHIPAAVMANPEIGTPGKPSHKRTKKARRKTATITIDLDAEKAFLRLQDAINSFTIVADEKNSNDQHFKNKADEAKKAQINGDIIVSNLLTRFENITKEASPIILATQVLIKDKELDIKYREELIKQVVEAWDKLIQINHSQLYPLKNDLDARITLLVTGAPITPVDGAHDLEEMKELKELENTQSPLDYWQTAHTQAHKKLKSTLQAFFNKFTLITLADDTSPDGEKFIELLTHFADDLAKDLQNSQLSLNSDVSDQLRTKMYYHLNKKTYWTQQWLIKKTLEAEESEELLQLLLPEQPASQSAGSLRKLINLVSKSTPEEHIDQLKTEFALVHHIIAKVRLFPIQEIKDYAILSGVQNQKSRDIQKIHDELIAGVPALKHELSRLKTLCFANTTPESEEEQNAFGQARSLIAALEQFETTLIAQNKLYHASYVTLNGVSDCSLVKMETDPGALSFASLAKTKESLQVRSAIMLFNHELYFANHHDESIKKLELTDENRRNYNALKGKFTNSIKSANNNELKLITSITGTRVSNPLERLQKITDLQSLRMETLQQQQAHLSGLITEQISPIKADLKNIYNAYMTSFTDELKIRINETRSALGATDKAPENIETRVREESGTVDLFIASRIHIKETAITGLPHTTVPQHQAAYDTALESLNSQVNACKGELIERYRERITAIKRRYVFRYSDPNNLNQLNPFVTRLKLANEAAEARHTEMTQMVASITDLQGNELASWKEDLEINLRETEQAIETMDTIRGKAEIIEQRLRNPFYRLSVDRILPALQGERDRIRTRYGHDDPRVTKLGTMIAQFTRINSAYINRELQAINTDANRIRTNRNERDTAEHYRLRLNDTVIAQLHNDHMETLSEGIRNRFIQWIRSHILKPIQETFTPAQQRGRFFTKGATLAEKKVIALGNQSLDDLNKDARLLDLELGCGLIRMSQNPGAMPTAKLKTALSMSHGYALFEQRIYFIDKSRRVTQLPDCNHNALDQLFPVEFNTLVTATQSQLSLITSLTSHTLELEPEPDSARLSNT